MYGSQDFGDVVSLWIPTIHGYGSACDSGGAKMTSTDTEHSSPGSLAIKIKRFSNKRSGSLPSELELSFSQPNTARISFKATPEYK